MKRPTNIVFNKFDAVSTSTYARNMSIIPFSVYTNYIRTLSFICYLASVIELYFRACFNNSLVY